MDISYFQICVICSNVFFLHVFISSADNLNFTCIYRIRNSEVFDRLLIIKFSLQLHFEHLITVYHPQVDLKSGQICMTRPSPLVYPEVPLDQHGRVSPTTQLFTVGVRSAKVQLVAAMVGLTVSHIVLSVMFLGSRRIVSAQEPRFLISSGSAVTVNSSVIT